MLRGVSNRRFSLSANHSLFMHHRTNHASLGGAIVLRFLFGRIVSLSPGKCATWGSICLPSPAPSLPALQLYIDSPSSFRSTSRLPHSTCRLCLPRCLSACLPPPLSVCMSASPADCLSVFSAGIGAEPSRHVIYWAILVFHRISFGIMRTKGLGGANYQPLVAVLVQLIWIAIWIFLLSCLFVLLWINFLSY